MQELIYKDEIDKKRKKLVKKILKIIFIVLFIFISSLLYTKFIATEGLIFKEERIVSSRIPNNFHGAKIIQFSDLDYGSTVYKDEVVSLVKKINLRKPDLIVFCGDLIDKDYNLSNSESENLIKELAKLQAGIGKYAVSGDLDDDRFNTILKQAGFTILNNEYDLIYLGENTPLLLTGISSKSKDRDINRAFSYYDVDANNKEIYSVLLMHEADDIDSIISKYKVDLALSGGSLNGQIYIPFIGPLIKRDGFMKYYDEHYKINDTSLYITSGVGTDGIQIRFLRRPSVNFFRLANH